MGISIPQLLIVLAILLLLFGTKRLRSIGSDLGNAVKGFRKAMTSDNEGDETSTDKAQQLDQKDADFRAQNDMQGFDKSQQEQASDVKSDSNRNAP